LPTPTLPSLPPLPPAPLPPPPFPLLSCLNSHLRSRPLPVLQPAPLLSTLSSATSVSVPASTALAPFKRSRHRADGRLKGIALMQNFGVVFFVKPSLS